MISILFYGDEEDINHEFICNYPNLATKGGGYELLSCSDRKGSRAG